jgi:hypothetical protein
MRPRLSFLRQSTRLRHSLASAAWGVQLAFWILIVLGFISWIMYSGHANANSNPNSYPKASVRQDSTAFRSSGQIQEPEVRETDWRRARQGWVRLSHEVSIPPQPLNFVQSISPLFWAAWLWLLSTWILVWSM